MSLVERAVKRLEELRKNSTDQAADEARFPSGGEAAVSVIEHTARKIDAPGAGRPGLHQAASAPEFAAAPSGPRADRDDPGDFVRREPRLGDPVGEMSEAGTIPRRSESASRQAQKLELDVRRLASLGFLDSDDLDGMMANEFRRIKRPLIHACQGKLAAPVKNPNRIMVTSSVQGEGKTFVALNLALSMAMERDITVLLVDADTTRRSLSRLIGISSRLGMLDVLAGGQVEVADALLQTNVEGLAVLPAGAPRRHATELLASGAMEQLVDELASRYESRILVFDTPPLLGTSETAVLATHMGQIIVVVEADKTSTKTLENALATIQSCPLVSTVLNKTSSREAGYYYYDAEK